MVYRAHDERFPRFEYLGGTVDESTLIRALLVLADPVTAMARGAGDGSSPTLVLAQAHRAVKAFGSQYRPRGKRTLDYEKRRILRCLRDFASFGELSVMQVVLDTCWSRGGSRLQAES